MTEVPSGPGERSPEGDILQTRAGPQHLVAALCDDRRMRSGSAEVPRIEAGPTGRRTRDREPPSQVELFRETFPRRICDMIRSARSEGRVGGIGCCVCSWSRMMTP